MRTVIKWSFLILGLLGGLTMTNEIRLQNGALSTTQVGAYNVYTGARYVPLIDGQWDSTKNYEPLTIVINQGNSYTSAQYVPAGVPLQENGPYWYLTGNFNGQISQIDTRLTADEVLIQTNKNNIEKINSDLNPTYLFLADSYGHNQNTTGWLDYIDNYIPGITYYALDWGGAGFYNPNFLNFQTLLTRFTEEQLQSANIIFVQSAGNDMGFEYMDIKNAMVAFVAKAKELCPNLTKIIVLPCVVDMGTKTGITGQFREMFSSLINNIDPIMTTTRGWEKVIHGACYVGSDNIHLTSDGVQLLTKQISCIINGTDMYCPGTTKEVPIGTTLHLYTSINGDTLNWSYSGTITIDQPNNPVFYTLASGSNTYFIRGIGNIGTVTIFNANHTYVGNMILNDKNITCNLTGIANETYTIQACGNLGLVFN